MRITCDTKDTLPLAALSEFQGGLKKRGDGDYEKIRKSIEKYGFATPFFVWTHDGVNHVLDGHGRLETLKRMRADGEEIPPLPVVYVDCKDEADAKNLLLRINSAYGTMTAESVMDFMGGGIELNIDEIALPCGTLELKFPTDKEIDLAKLDEIPGNADAVCKRGDIWILGEHRLMCGDSTDAGDVSSLMGGERADITFTSPPYNMAQGGNFGKSEKTKKTMRGGHAYENYGDDLTDEKYSQFLINAVRNALNNSDDAMFNIGILQGSKRGICALLNEFQNNLIDIVVWNKSNGMPSGFKNFSGRLTHKAEMIFCFGQKNTINFTHPQWSVGSKTNVIESTNASGNKYAKIHGATFPVEFALEVVKSFSEKSVLDLFCGTGTTLLSFSLSFYQFFLDFQSSRQALYSRRERAISVYLSTHPSK